MAGATSIAGSVDLSVISPLHNEAANARTLYTEICAALEPLGRSFEVLLVNDGSTDDTGAILDALAMEDPRLRQVHLDGNFGEAAALSAGFAQARGNIVLTLDGDLQNDPADLPRLLTMLERGPYQAVSGYRRKRLEPLLPRVLPSVVANALIAWVTGVPSRDNGCGLKAYRRQVLCGVCLPDGFHRFMPAIFGVKAPEFAQVEVADRRRAAGHSHYGWTRFFAVIRELIAVPHVIRGPFRALQLTERWLTLAVLLCIVAGVGSVIRPDIAWTFPVALGFTAYMVCLRWNLQRWVRAQRDPTYRIRSHRPEAVREERPVDQQGKMAA